MSGDKKGWWETRLIRPGFNWLVILFVSVLAMLREELTNIAGSWFVELMLDFGRRACVYLHEHASAVFMTLDLVEVTTAACLLGWVPFVRPSSPCRLPLAVYSFLVGWHYGLIIWARDAGGVVANMPGSVVREQLYMGMSLCLIWIVTRVVKREGLFFSFAAVAIAVGCLAQLKAVDPHIITAYVSLYGVVSASVASFVLWSNFTPTVRACALVYVTALACRPIVIWSDSIALNFVYAMAMLFKFIVIAACFGALPPPFGRAVWRYNTVRR